MMARGQLQSVLLVEVDLEAGRGVPGDGTWHPDSDTEGLPAGRPRSPRRRGWPVAAVLVAVLAFGWATSEIRDRERADRIAALPGALAPLSPGMRESWRAPMRGWGQLAAIGGDVTLYGHDPSGAEAVVSYAAATGAQRWITPLPEVTAGGDVWCAPVAQAVYVVCRLVLETAPVESAPVESAPVETAPFQAAPLAQPGGGGSAQLTRLLVLDAATGARVAEREVDGTGVLFAAIDRDLVVSELTADGHALVTREDPATGRVRWTFRSPQALQSLEGGSTWLNPSVQHGVVVVNGPVTWALAADGRPLGEWHLQGGEWAIRGGWGLDLTVLPDGRYAVGESGGVGLSDADYGTVSTTDARNGYPISGRVLEPVVDDGSAADVLLTVPPDRGGMVAQDLATGKRLWDLGNMPWGDALVLDKRLVVVVGRDVRALDVHTGTVLWSVEVPGGIHGGQLLTDGRVVAVPMFSSALGPYLAALDPADGRSLWTARLAPGFTRLESLGGRLAELTDQELIVLG